jgi:Zn-dependent peptidase ImmA (M78 family)
MTLTSNQSSLLYQLRSLVPARPLTQFEAYRLAELQANRMLEAANIDQPGTPDELIMGLPFLSVSLRSDLPVSGLTRWVKPRWQIYLNKNEPAVRRRYSVMHEFKHILDHGISDHLYPKNQWNNSEVRAEKICDYFAASLLMPKRLIKRRFFEGLNDPIELAAEFGVSPVAMRYRLDQLMLTEPIPRCDRQLLNRTPIEELSDYLRQATIERLPA